MQTLQMTLLTDKEYITIIELSKLLCVPENVIVEWVEHEVVCAKYEKETCYISTSEITKARSAMRLASELGLNAPGIAVIMQLKKKISSLEAMLRL